MSSNANYNPYNPHALGVEWFANIEDRPNVPYGGELPGTTLESRYTETINYIRPFVTRNGIGKWLMEVYDVANIPVATLTERTFVPGEDAFNDTRAYGWGAFSPGGTQTDIYRAINNLTLTPGIWPNSGNPVTDNSFLFPIFGSAYEAGFRFAGITGTYTNEQIVSLTLFATVEQFIDLGGQAGMSIQPYLNIGGTRYFGETFTIPGEETREALRTWDLNPATGSSWTIADLEEFASGSGTSYAGWFVSATGSSNVLSTIMQGQLRVVDAGPDPRVAIGVVPQPSPNNIQDGWVNVPVADPVTGLGWAKTIGTKYLILMRKATGEGTLQWRYLRQRGSDVPSGPVIKGTTVTLNPDSFRPETPIAEDNAQRGYTFLLRENLNSAIGASIDSQPYASINDDRGISGEAEGTLSKFPRPGEGFWTRVHSANTKTGQGDAFIEQDFTPAITDQYGFMRLFVRIVPNVDGSFDEELISRLVVRVFDRATNTQQGKTIFITPDDLFPNKTRFQTVTKRIPGVAPVLLAGQQYYTKVTSAAIPTSKGSWAVQVLSGVPFHPNNPPPAGTGDATAGGSIDAYTRIPPSNPVAGNYPTLDACIVIHTIPDPVQNFAAAATAPPVGIAACSTGDADDAVNYVELMWDSTSISVQEGGGFDYYEIQRLDGDNGEWDTIALITDETCNMAEDHEARIGCEVQYRIRVVRVDGSPSDWMTVGPVTLSMNVGGFVFTTNFFPEKRLWYQDTNPRTFEFLSNQTNRQFYGRDGSVTFYELEDRYDRIPMELIVKGGEARCIEAGENDTACPRTTVGRRVFEPMTVLVGNKKDPVLGQKLTLPYVTVRDQNGNRWFSSIETPDGEVQVATFYTMNAIATETTQTPTPFDKRCAPFVGTGSGSGEPFCQLIFDSFPGGTGSASGSGANGCTLLGVSTSGNEWLFTDTPQQWCKFTGVAAPVGAAAPPIAYFAQLTRNNYAAADYIENGSTGWALIARGTDASNFVMVNITATTVSIYEVVAGVSTLLGSTGGGGTDGVNYRLEVEGGFVTLKADALPVLGPLATTVTNGFWTGQWERPISLITDSGADIAWSTVDSPLFDAEGYAADDPVDSWPNELFGAGLAPLVQGTGSKQPLYKPTGLNGSPCVQFFSATFDALDVALSITRGQYQVFVAANLDAGDSTEHRMLAFSSVGNDVTVGMNAANNVIIRDDANGPSATPADTSPHLLLSRFGVFGVENDLLVQDDVTVADADIADQATLDIITLGRAVTQWTNVQFGGFWSFPTDPRVEPEWNAFVARCNSVWGTAWPVSAPVRPQYSNFASGCL